MSLSVSLSVTLSAASDSLASGNLPHGDHSYIAISLSVCLSVCDSDIDVQAVHNRHRQVKSP